ncbi:MAG: RdgB/HAM1 family non-canonical purine NTP pyrophosphatase [Treponema sp.]|jgi:XTP/dITP diphosphohydrolase|nr:RdgB/HAM1 family non-canonical purine NTP pyrophosphatase [Treponema sp.]
MTVWFATGNIHKKRELILIIEERSPDAELLIPAEEGIAFDPEETGASFLENAFIKARSLYRLAATAGRAGPVIADDSGLCVDALGGRPGIYSSRYGGGRGKLGDGERNALLLEELGDNPRRNARFVCAMVLLWNEDRFFAAQETLEGELVSSVQAAKGGGGFGYDPILYLPEKGCTVAELPEAEKNRISHRGKAGRIIAGMLAGA